MTPQPAITTASTDALTESVAKTSLSSTAATDATPTTSGPRQITGYAALSAGGALKPWTYDAPALGPNDVEVSITHCGVCHTDLAVLDQTFGPTRFPSIVGHEIVGTISAIGSAVPSTYLHTRVGIGAQCGSCRTCSSCLHGLDNTCAHGPVLTYNAALADGRATHGGFAAAVRVPLEYTFPLPASLPSTAAAPLMCAGVTVYAPLKRYLSPGARVGVVGIGGLGHLAIQFARALGAGEVVAISTSRGKEADSAKLGASKFVVLDSPAAFAANAESVDLLLLTACGKGGEPVDGYLSLVAANGRMVVVGLPEAPVSVHMASLVARQRSMTGSLIGSRADVQEMLTVAAKHGIAPWTETSKMADVNAALARVRKGEVRYRMVLEN
ncbi:hypothetical protein H9P43_008617 [Blastocladiella emersonii ATCC 22665]|nr:hypothetical protein H9P43_008617 [Blastocladiella emersonii ATCC 22665]